MGVCNERIKYFLEFLYYKKDEHIPPRLPSKVLKILRILVYNTWHMIEAPPTEPLEEFRTSKVP